MSLVALKVDDRAVVSAFDRLAKFGQDQSVATARIAQQMLRSTEDNFANEGRPKWAPMARSTRAQRGAGAKLLQKSGKLAASITPFSTSNTAGVGTNRKYAIYQQNKTRPHIIKPKNKKALYWLGAGHPVKQVNHPGTPARPFFNLTDQDKLDIVAIINQHIRSIAG